MDLRILDPSTAPSSIEGFTVVVDVFRAFSVSYFIHANRPAKYIVVDDIDLAFKLKAEMPGSILVGERRGLKIEGFDYGNSPTEIIGEDFNGRTVIHTTSAGTRGLALQPRRNRVAVGSFVNCAALEAYVRRESIDVVNIYCTAERGEPFGEEDYLFAEHISRRLRGETSDFTAIRERLRAGSGRGFADGGFAPASDFDYCMDLDRFDAVLVRKLVQGATHEIELVPVKR